jgi:hypothetical protein
VGILLILFYTSSKGSNPSFKFAPVEVNTVQKPIVGLLSYQEILESSDKHCIGQSPNCDPGMFTSSSSFLKRLVIFYACEVFCRFYGLSLSYYLLRHLEFSHCLSLFYIIIYTFDQTSCTFFSSWQKVIFGPKDAVICWNLEELVEESLYQLPGFGLNASLMAGSLTVVAFVLMTL